MSTGVRLHYTVSLTIVLALILAACQSTASPVPVVETLVVTEVVEATPVEVVHVVTPTPEPSGPRTLVICMGAEPASLYPFGEDVNYDFLVNNAFAKGIGAPTIPIPTHTSRLSWRSCLIWQMVMQPWLW